MRIYPRKSLLLPWVARRRDSIERSIVYRLVPAGCARGRDVEGAPEGDGGGVVVNREERVDVVQVPQLEEKFARHIVDAAVVAVGAHAKSVEGDIAFCEPAAGDVLSSSCLNEPGFGRLA